MWVASGERGGRLMPGVDPSSGACAESSLAWHRNTTPAHASQGRRSPLALCHGTGHRYGRVERYQKPSMKVKAAIAPHIAARPCWRICHMRVPAAMEARSMMMNAARAMA